MSSPSERQNIVPGERRSLDLKRSSAGWIMSAMKPVELNGAIVPFQPKRLLPKIEIARFFGMAASNVAIEVSAAPLLETITHK
jgi:hypothetical protein